MTQGSVIGHSKVATKINNQALTSSLFAFVSFKKAVSTKAKVTPAKVQYPIAINLRKNILGTAQFSHTFLEPVCKSEIFTILSIKGGCLPDFHKGSQRIVPKDEDGVN